MERIRRWKGNAEPGDRKLTRNEDRDGGKLGKGGFIENKGKKKKT